MTRRHGFRQAVRGVIFIGAVFGCVVLLCGGHNPTHAEDLRQDNVVVVLDASGSMRDPMQAAADSGRRRSKMDVAKNALLQVLEVVSPETNVGVLVFSGKGNLDPLIHPLAPVDRSRLEVAVKRIAPSGSTPLGDFLKRGTDLLLEQRAKQRGYGSFRLLVVTDGQASDPALMNAVLPDILSRGITIDVVGVDMGSDHALATRVHAYRRANDPAALTRVLTEAFAEIGGNQDDAADEEAFDEIAGIPDEMAAALVKALSNRSHTNSPVQAVRRVQRRTPATGSPAGPGTASSPSAPPASGSGGPPPILIIIIIIVVVAMFRGALGGRRKRRRRRSR